MRFTTAAWTLLAATALWAQLAAAAPLPRTVMVSQRTELVPVTVASAFGRLASPAWSTPAPAAFLARNSGTWVHRVMGPTKDFRVVYGTGVEVDPAAITDQDAATAAVIGFLGDNPELLPPGVTVADLELVANELFDGMRFVAFRQTLAGAPVIGTTVHAAIIAGRLVLAHVKAYPVQELSRRWLPSRRLPVAKLESLAVVAAQDLGIQTVVAQSSRVAVLPVSEPQGLVLRRVQVVELSAPYARFTAYLDQVDGSVVALRDNRQFFEGALRLRHHERNPDPQESLIESPAEDLLVQVGKTNVYTDEEGLFAVQEDSISAFTAQLSGKYVDVRNAAGQDFKLSVSAATPLTSGTSYTMADSDEFDMAQIDAFAFTTTVRAFAKSLAFQDLAFFNSPMQVNVNVSVDLGNDGQPDYCNAYFDGQSLNFLPQGDMYGTYVCNNTAMIADILYHEYGHALHYNSALSGQGSFDEAVSEGFSDTMATALTGDNVLGRFFIKTGQGIRDVKNEMVWPDDQSQDPHQTGLIVAGAIWDLRETFQAKFGEEAGAQLTNSMFGSAMATSTDIMSVFESFLLADDDNGDLADGTPNFCDIFGAFAHHGLAADDLGRITITHTPLANLLPSPEAVVVEAEVAEGAEDCSTLGEVRVVFSIDEGANWTTTVAENLGGGSYAATLTTVSPGSRLLYRLEAVDVDSGLVSKRPSNPAEPYYVAYVGELTTIAFDDFETADATWTHELVAGRERETSDDWARGKPRGDGGDATAAYSGEYVWGNDLRPKITWDGQYDGNIHNALMSPVYDLSKYENVRLQFRRWLSVEDGYFDQAMLLVNGVKVWANAVSPGGDQANHSLHHIDKEWVLFDLDISDLAAGQSEVRFRFELKSDRGLQMGGWNIDDFALYTTKMPAPDQSDTDEPGINGDTDPGMSDQADDAVTAMAGGCGCRATGHGLLGAAWLGLLASLI